MGPVFPRARWDDFRHFHSLEAPDILFALEYWLNWRNVTLEGIYKEGFI